MTSKQNDPYVEFLHYVLDEAAGLMIEHFPAMKELTLETLEVIFAPKAMFRQLVLAVALQTGAVTVEQVTRIVTMVLSNFSSRSRLIRHLEREQQNASTQDEWMDLAERIDNIQGNDVWRSDPNCQLYERERISARIDEFVHLMRRHDIFELMFVLRGGIGRNKFGLLHEGLFSKALAGSKVLVETYHNVVCAALDFVCDAPVAVGDAPIPTDARLAFFNETRHSYGRTALLLSGGAALGFYHVGVAQTLMKNRLMPRVIGGSSAGSIVCAMLGTRTDEECTRDLYDVKGTTSPGHSGRLALNFFRPLGATKGTGNGGNASMEGSGERSQLSEVYHNTAGAFHDAKRTWQLLFPIGLRQITDVLYDVLTGSRRPQDILMSDTQHFAECVRLNVGDFTFQEAFDRTGRILNITVTPKNSSDPPRLLNYLTAPHVLVWSAAVASSSLPGVFEANRLKVRDADGTERYESAEGAKFSDGSMEQDLPMQQLAEMFNVNHFIISQANPHAVMFASYNQARSVWTNPLMGMINAISFFLKERVRSWLANVVELVGAQRIAPSQATSRVIGSTFFTQEYEGRDCDVSLIPWLSHRGLFSAILHCLYNPSEEEFREWITASERETWKHIPAIKSHIAEEVTLDRCVQRLRKRVVAESWAKRRQDSTGKKMGERVPSFFTSPSLVKLGGLGISDQTNIEGIGRYDHSEAPNPAVEQARAADPPNHPLDHNSGWAGLGLRGNRSSGSLERCASQTSGLFIDGDEAPSMEQQVAGEQTVPPYVQKPSTGSLSDSMGGNGYVKTTSMARFYYRKTGSYGNLPRSQSDGQGMDRASEESDESDGGTNQMTHARRKSKSHTDLAQTLRGADQ